MLLALKQLRVHGCDAGGAAAPQIAYLLARGDGETQSKALEKALQALPLRKHIKVIQGQLCCYLSIRPFEQVLLRCICSRALHATGGM
jgi:hypothetical protein